MSDLVIYSGAISADGHPIAEGGANGQGGTFLLRLAGLAAATDAYIQKVLGYAPIAYYPLNEASGTTAEDLSGSGFDGTYSGAAPGGTGIGDGNTAASFDGTSDVVTMGAIDTPFDGNAGTLLLWGKTSAAVWSDGTTRYLVRLIADGANLISIHKTTTTNQLQLRRNAGVASKFVVSTALVGTEAPFSAAITWDTVANQMKAYLNGAQVGATQANIDTFAGALTDATIGAQNASATASWSGQIAHVALFNRALTALEIADLATL